ncbi:protein-tyrosine phosphatase-like protein [Trichoderma longibrachiatum]|uniref:Phosphatases II n=1 Tax=Trichoderma citrinoviride TaxID=58853 RepID=A0A2T4AWR5_9HYPO|nr:phosphatases II [Trichoderma citrinoviride]PTB61493.1 phosphatases II [Trichoderma citrinoviride]
MDHGPNRSFVVACSPYSYRAPSPPVIGVPVKSRDDSQIVLEPLPGRVHPSLISRENLAIITGNRQQVSVDNTWLWKYEHRREAQRILDYLYLGPASIVRDHDFLRREAITMIVVVRDGRAPMVLGSLQRAAATLGISAGYIDINPNHILAAFYEIVSVINNHLLSNHFCRKEVADGSRGLGKVLVVCDSGTDRGPPLVAAYIMAVFGQDIMTALQFVNIQRFCCNFTEDAKRALLTWDGLLKAGALVAMQSAHDDTLLFTDKAACYKTSTKRAIDDLMEDVDEKMGCDALADGERFEGRETFVPFQEISY